MVPDTAAPQPPPDTDPLLSDMGPGEGGCVGCSPNGPDDHGEPYGIGEEVARPASVVRVGVGGVQQPRKIRDVVPRYPDLARLAGVEGTVIIECTIDPQGNVVGAQVLKGHPLLDAAAIDAVQQWRYTPTLLNGVPVSVVMTVTAQFHLRR